jgi:hypothetical protein
LFNLCLAGVGGAAHPDHLEKMLTGDQLIEWEEFDRLEPVGGYKQDFRFAQLCDLLYILSAAHGGQKVQSRLQDFMPWWIVQYFKDTAKTGGGQSVKEIGNNLKEWARQHNRALDHKARKGK